jgi:hypothetical protein
MGQEKFGSKQSTPDKLISIELRFAITLLRFPKFSGHYRQALQLCNIGEFGRVMCA